MLSGSLFIPILSWTGSAIQLAGVVSGTIFLYIPSPGETNSPKATWAVYLSLILSLTVDTLNTAGLATFLHRQRQKNNHQRSVILLSSFDTMP